LHLSGVLYDTGDLYAASRAARRALAIYQESANVDGEVSAWNQCGEIDWRLGFFPRAEAALRRGAELAEESGSAHGKVLAYHALTSVLVDAGRPEEAESLARAAVDRARDTGDRHLVDSADISLALVLDATGRDAEALPIFQRLAEMGGRETVPPLTGLARIRLRAGDFDRAAALARSAYDVATSYSLAWRAAVALVLRAEIELAAGDRPGAWEMAEDARARLARMGDRATLARAREVLARAG